MLAIGKIRNKYEGLNIGKQRRILAYAINTIVLGIDNLSVKIGIEQLIKCSKEI